MLLAGFRGSGKTALIEAALSWVRTGRQLVVKLSPPTVAGDDTDRNSVRAQVLRSLSRGLYFALLDDGGGSDELKQRVEASYEKTYLTDLETHSVAEAVATAEATQNNTTTVKSSFDLSWTVKLLLGASVTGVVASAGLGTATAIGRTAGGWGLAAFAGIALSAIASGVVVDRTRSKETTVADTVTQKDSRSQVGRLDLSTETLEFELRRALEGLAEANYRVIFVLDELDKLTDVPESAVEETTVFRIVSSLKNFFALGSAVYVFITDDAFFERLALRLQDTAYSLPHTVFTDRFFLGPLHYTELEVLIEKSLLKPLALEAFDEFKNFVCWESNNHVFDAIQTLSAYVSYDGDRPMLRPSESGIADGAWSEGNLPADWRTRAALQSTLASRSTKRVAQAPRTRCTTRRCGSRCT